MPGEEHRLHPPCHRRSPALHSQTACQRETATRRAQCWSQALLGGKWLSFVELCEPGCKKGEPGGLIRDAGSCWRMCRRALDEHPTGTRFAASFSP